MAWAAYWRAWSGDTASAVGLDARWRDFATVYAWFLALQFLDVLSTATVLQLGGLEGNPVGAQAFDGQGARGLMLLKAGLVAFTLATWVPAASYLLRKGAGPSAALVALIAAAGAYYAAIVFWNLAHLAILLRA